MFKKVLVICTLLFGLFYCGWGPQYSGTTANLNDVYFYNDSLTGYICGDSGIILKTTNSGVNWIRQNTPVNTKLNSIYFLGDTGWCVGNHGTILMTIDGGLTWEGDSSGLTNFYDVWYFNSYVGLVLGDAGFIYKTTDGGRTWFIVILPTNAPRKMFFINNSLGWVVGNSATCLKTTDGGEYWEFVQIPIPISIKLRDVYFLNSDTGYAVGGFGTFAKTTDGGQNWEVNNLLVNLYGFDFEDSYIGYICGGEGHIFKIPSGQDTIVNPSIDLYSINFPVPRVGWTVGSNGSIYKTSDGMAVAEKLNKRDVSSISCSPNPFTDYLILRIPANGRMKRLKIYNTLGKVIIDNEVKDGLLRINSKSLTKGVYFIKANNTVTKVIKI
jgi:photosystem II stability/assembly factor-like uncharacterized protein